MRKVGEENLENRWNAHGVAAAALIGQHKTMRAAGIETLLSVNHHSPCRLPVPLI